VHKTRAKVRRTYDTEHGPLTLRYTMKDLRRGDINAPKANQQLAAWYSSLSSTMQDAVRQPATRRSQLSLQMLLADPRRILALDPDMLGTPEGRERISASVTAVLERVLTRRYREAARRREEENANEEEAARVEEERMPPLQQRAPKRTGQEEKRRVNVAESVDDDEDDDDWVDEEEEDDEEEGGNRKRRKEDDRRPLAVRNYEAARPLLYSGTLIPSTSASTTERVRDLTTSASPRPSPPQPIPLASQSPSAQPNSAITTTTRSQSTPQTPIGSPVPRRRLPPIGRMAQPRSKQQPPGTAHSA
jgi:hypothetical protein